MKRKNHNWTPTVYGTPCRCKHCGIAYSDESPRPPCEYVAAPKLYSAADIKAAEEKAWDAAREVLVHKPGTCMEIRMQRFETIAEWRQERGKS